MNLKVANTCLVFSRKDKAIEWRPHAHHLLHTNDGHFDHRFNAFLKCEMHLNELYQNSIQNRHKVLVEKMLNELKQFSSEQFTCRTNTVKASSLHITCITSSLSNPDLQVLVEYLASTLSTVSDTIIVQTRCHNVMSAHDVMCEVADNLRVVIDQKNKFEKRMASINTLLSKQKGLSTRMMNEMPSQYLSDLLSSNELTGKRSLVLIMTNAEKIDDDVLSDFLEMLGGISGIFAQIITFNASVCPLPLRISKSAQMLVSASVEGTSTNWEVYDEFIGKVISARQLPISLSSDVWSWIHEIFWRSSCCVKSALDIIIFAISHHFSQRRSLLCMFADTQWLLDMKLIKKCGKTEEEKLHGAINDILTHFSSDDLLETGLNATGTSPIVWIDQVNFAERKLQANISRSRLDKLWFMCLREARDTCLLHGDSQISEFCSDILWASITSISGVLFSHDSDLINAISSNMTRVPLTLIHSLIQSCRVCFDDIHIHLETIYNSGSLEDNLAKSSDQHMPNKSDSSWTNLKARMVKESLALKSELCDLFTVFEECITWIRANGVPMNVCQADLPKHVTFTSQNDRIFPPDTISELSTSHPSLLTEVQVVGNQAGMTATGNGDIISSSLASFGQPKAEQQNCHESSHLSLQRSDQQRENSSEGMHDDLISSKTICSFLDIAIEELVQWLRTVGAFFRKVPRPDRIPGVLDIAKIDVDNTLQAAEGNVRSKYLQTLTDTSQYLLSDLDHPDVSILSKIVFNSVSSASIFDWFDAFKDGSRKWEQVTTNQKKRKREEDTEMPNSTLLKCRFVKALSDLEKIGVVKIKNGGMEVTRTSYVWMSSH
jgi:hypothetical protein